MVLSCCSWGLGQWFAGKRRSEAEQKKDGYWKGVQRKILKCSDDKKFFFFYFCQVPNRIGKVNARFLCSRSAEGK